MAKSLLRIWQYALGCYSDDKTAPYDKPMLVIKTFWVLLHITTCLFIVAGNGKTLGLW